ncbi:MAG: hypothetical protein LBW77_04890, partial [Verrucomicrobiota bacterium]|nr:hypothetical protein [Verrucomicrobiota bacterium]
MRTGFDFHFFSRRWNADGTQTGFSNPVNPGYMRPEGEILAKIYASVRIHASRFFSQDFPFG